MLKTPAHASIPTALLFTALATLLLLLTGCGINPDEPVYDTANNPDNFPDQAVNLVDNIQSGRLGESDAIIDAFSDLYSENPSLLGNNEWKEVVLKLGVKLRHTADQLAKEGILSYSKAAGLYHVAAFARPNDPRIQTMDRLFSRWQGEVPDSLVSLYRTVPSSSTDLGIIVAKIEQLKRFQFADSLAAEFASLYLHNLLFEPFTSDRNRANAILDSLSPAEQTFLISIGVSNRPIETIIGRFDQPLIDMVAVDLIKLTSSVYRAEVYFLPKEAISDDLTVAFWVDSPDSIPGEQAENANYFPYDITPVKASSDWPTDQISVAYREFSFDWPISAVSIGLYSQTEKEVRFLPIVSSRGSTVETDSITRKGSDEFIRGSGNLIRVLLEPIGSN